MKSRLDSSIKKISKLHTDEKKGKKTLLVSKVKKRDGRIVNFDLDKITNAIYKAAEAVGGKDRKTAEFLSMRVVEILEEKFDGRSVPSVEEIQDIVEKVLIENGHAKTAKAYILYRQKRKDQKSWSKGPRLRCSTGRPCRCRTRLGSTGSRLRSRGGPLRGDHRSDCRHSTPGPSRHPGRSRTGSPPTHPKRANHTAENTTRNSSDIGLKLNRSRAVPTIGTAPPGSRRC